MRVIKKIHKMQRISEGFRKKDKIIAFVPTMVALHEGHLSLMKKGRKLSDILIVSIFVNPIQFNDKEDYEKYPRDDKRDLKLAKDAGVDIVFLPKAKEIYPEGFQTHVEVETLTKPLCGAFRPGHFMGVTTVVAKLFNIVKPHIAIFGEKDFQQLKVIQRMVRDLNFDIKIISGKTVRERDGIAMSSRNTLLNPEERRKAGVIHRALKYAKELFEKGERSAEKLVQGARRILESVEGLSTEYIEIVNPDTLENIKEINNKALIATAVYIGKVRLIDNLMLGR